ncbi:MAG: hypothetical protein OXF06_07400 [Bacteroidetes bacterium]|nr:hypothetical protein [Bacteroidota bacterium]
MGAKTYGHDFTAYLLLHMPRKRGRRFWCRARQGRASPHCYTRYALSPKAGCSQTSGDRNYGTQLRWPRHWGSPTP